MKKIFLYMLGILLLPLYTILKRCQQQLAEKIRLGEKVVVVTRYKDGKKKTFTN
jgi:hypothetical protein